MIVIDFRGAERGASPKAATCKFWSLRQNLATVQVAAGADR